PKNVDPAGAIQQYKLTGAAHWFKSVLLPWGRK
ncbi:MAG: fumarate reductase iron-sulfur subunit, partial [Terriglobia bacterium]